MTEHIFIKLPRWEWEEQRDRFAHVFDEESGYCEIPNSIRISGQPYKPHPQFTITILGNKITVWSNINEAKPEDES